MSKDEVQSGINVENISNEVGLVKNVSSWFLLVLCTPACLRSCAWLIALSVSTSFRFTFTRPARPIRFIASVLPTRHLFGPC
jgi:hypothetical protein